MRTHTAAALLVAVLSLAGCTSAPATPPTPTATDRTDVDWSKYGDSYQRIVDEETDEKDCAALQEMFDAAPDDPALLNYIDEALTTADCY